MEEIERVYNYLLRWQGARKGRAFILITSEENGTDVDVKGGLQGSQKVLKESLHHMSKDTELGSIIAEMNTQTIFLS